jgi:hypothetical protein
VSGVFGLRLGAYSPAPGGPPALGLVSGLLEEPAWTPDPRLAAPACLVMTIPPVLALTWERREDHPLPGRSSAGVAPEKWVGPASNRGEDLPFQAQMEGVEWAPASPAGVPAGCVPV